MKRIALLIAALLALVPAVAHAAFPGRNGAIAFGAYRADIVGDAEGGDTSYDVWQVGMRIGPGRVSSLAGCSEHVETNCRGRQYAGPAFSPDGRRLAMSVGDALTVLDLGNGTIVPEPSFGYGSWSPAFAPDGRRVAFIRAHLGRASDLSILDLRTRQARLVIRDARDPAWSTKGWIAFVRERGICRVRPNGRDVRLIVTGAYAPAWSSDGTRLAFARSTVVRDGRVVRHGGVFVSDAAGHHPDRVTLAAPYEDPSDVASSPDGRRLVIAASRPMTVDLRGAVARRLPIPALAGAWDTTVDWQPLAR